MNDKTIDAKISISEDLGSRADGAIRDFWTPGFLSRLEPAEPSATAVWIGTNFVAFDGPIKNAYIIPGRMVEKWD